MKFEEIKPYARYVRYLKITESSNYSMCIPLDCRLFYVKSGIGKFLIGGNVITMPKNSVLYINSNIPYKILPTDVKYIAVNFDFTSKFSHLSTPLPPIYQKDKGRINIVEHIKICDATCFDKYFFIENCASICEYFEALNNEFSEKPPFYSMKCSHYISNILIDLYRKKEFLIHTNHKFDAKEIADFIIKNLTEDLSNKHLAEIFHFHPNYMSAKFTEYYGKTLHAYILEMRILKSISLLEESNESISKIASMVGFPDSNYFSRYFKRITGISPQKYKFQKMDSN